MDRKTISALAFAIVICVLGLVPENEQAFVAIKAVLDALFIGYLFYLLSGSMLEKRIQVLVNDVANDRVGEYERVLRSSLGAVGRVVTLDAHEYQIALGVEGKRSPEDVQKAIKRSKLKLHLLGVLGTMKYISLEASAQMLVAISGRATPGSVISIDGVGERIYVSDSGSFVVQVPFSIVRKHTEKGFIPARCSKGSLVDDIQIPIPR